MASPTIEFEGYTISLLVGLEELQILIAKYEETIAAFHEPHIILKSLRVIAKVGR